MATTISKYINGSDFLTATAVYDDVALTTPSADGFYQISGVYREQSAGVLLAGSSACPSCSTLLEFCYDAASATSACCDCVVPV